MSALVKINERVPSLEEIDSFIEFFKQFHFDDVKQQTRDVFGYRIVCVLNDEELKKAIENECLERIKQYYAGYLKTTQMFTFANELRELAKQCSDEMFEQIKKLRKWCDKSDDVIEKLKEAKKNKDGRFKLWLS